MLFLEIFIVTKNNAVEKTSPIFAILEPITFEIDISLESFKAELILIKSSGAEVANEGEKQFKGITKCQTGWSRRAKRVIAEVADITQPLMAVGK